MLHGRGASADGILSLAELLAQRDLAYLSPQAARRSWYPHSCLAPLADNEPWLSSALQVVGDLMDGLAQRGFPPGRILLLGFSQGGCLALEFAARNARRYGAVVGLSAGLIGPMRPSIDLSPVRHPDIARLQQRGSSRSADAHEPPAICAASAVILHITTTCHTINDEIGRAETCRGLGRRRYLTGVRKSRAPCKNSKDVPAGASPSSSAPVHAPSSSR